MHAGLKGTHSCPQGFQEYVADCKVHLSTEQDHIPVMRGQWFIDGTWLPLEEEESDLIEEEHLNHFRGQQMQDTIETDLVVKTVDSKDGKYQVKMRGKLLKYYVNIENSKLSLDSTSVFKAKFLFLWNLSLL